MSANKHLDPTRLQDRRVSRTAPKVDTGARIKTMRRADMSTLVNNYKGKG